MKEQNGHNFAISYCMHLFNKSCEERYVNILRYTPLGTRAWNLVRACFELFDPEFVNVDQLLEEIRKTIAPPSSDLSSCKDKVSAEILVSVVGSSEQLLVEVKEEIEREVRACIKFIVPYEFSTTEKLISNSTYDLIRKPPLSMLEFAALAKKNKGDPRALLESQLHPELIDAPHVFIDGKDIGTLTKYPQGRRFKDQEMNRYMEILFEIIAVVGPDIGFNVKLNRFDLFHGHMFIGKDGRLGILFHSKEYPAKDSKFNIDLGYFQKGSTLRYDEESMNLRNVLFLAPSVGDSTIEILEPGVLVCLDARRGGIIYRDIVFDGLQPLRTIYEGDFGVHLCDVNYFNVGTIQHPNYWMLIC